MTRLEKPLTGLEIRALNRVGLIPQNLPSSLDDYVRKYLWEKAEVDATPASSSNMKGAWAAGFDSWCTSVFLREGGAIAGAAQTTRSIRQQTGVQEWIHWKKYALEQSDFDAYKTEWTKKYEDIHKVMVKYIRSEKGVLCCDYEHWRPLARVAIVVISSFGSAIGWIAALFANWSLVQNKGVTLPEWVIQKTLRKQSFASIRPRGGVNSEGELILEY